MLLSWYVAKVKSGKEKLVGELLHRRGIEVYCPQIIGRRNGHRGWEYLFPGYLLCRLELSPPKWPAVLWLPGMKYFLPKEGKPVPLEERVVDELNRWVAEWNAGGWLKAFKPGRQVVITGGVLKGVKALFQRYLPPKERCWVLISLLGRKLEVEIDIAALKPL